MPCRLLVMINQGGERICTGLAEKGQAYPFKFPLLLYQKFEIQRRNYHLKSSHALYKKAGGTHIFILLVFYRQLTPVIWKTKCIKCIIEIWSGLPMLFALYDFLAYCLYSISRFSGESVLLCAAFSEKPAVFVMQRIR